MCELLTRLISGDVKLDERLPEVIMKIAEAKTSRFFFEQELADTFQGKFRAEDIDDFLTLDTRIKARYAAIGKALFKAKKATKEEAEVGKGASRHVQVTPTVQREMDYLVASFARFKQLDHQEPSEHVGWNVIETAGACEVRVCLFRGGDLGLAGSGLGVEVV